MSNEQRTQTHGAAVPGARPGAPVAETAPDATSLEVLETLARLPVAEHLAIFEDLQASLAADLESTSQEHT